MIQILADYKNITIAKNDQQLVIDEIAKKMHDATDLKTRLIRCAQLKPECEKYEAIKAEQDACHIRFMAELLK